jgi:ABC-type dipeptide/oligopeptide/nickel transport system ATPase component
MSSSEDSKHYISDQDSSDESPQISSIIKEKSKIFQNESFIIKILLTDHFRQQRAKFFSLIRRHPGSIYQAIKKEIRNCLNPYRIFIEKEAKTSEQLKELYNLLKSYFKEKNFNNTFFINYFKDLEKAHKKKSKYLSMLPSDEVEVLNDLQRKVAIIRALRHYVSTTIRDRIQINYDKKKIHHRVMEVLELVGLKSKVRMYPDQLSGGEQQRVVIARAIVNNPKLLICDEPTGNLDPDTSMGIMKVLDDINKMGTTIIMSTHNRDIVNAMKKRVVVLDQGKIIQDYERGKYYEVL